MPAFADTFRISSSASHWLISSSSLLAVRLPGASGAVDELPVVAPKGRWGVAFDYAQIVAGSLLVAAGTNLFFVPNNVVSGGVTGLSIIAHHLFKTPVGMVVLVLNLPLLWLGWRFAGGIRFFVRTVVSVMILSIAIDLTAPFLVPPTHDRLLVICYGGLIDGRGSCFGGEGRPAAPTSLPGSPTATWGSGSGRRCSP